MKTANSPGKRQCQIKSDQENPPESPFSKGDLIFYPLKRMLDATSPMLANSQKLTINSSLLPVKGKVWYKSGNFDRIIAVEPSPGFPAENHN